MKKIDRIAIFVGFVILLLTMFIFNSILISRLPEPKEEKLELKIGESYEVEFDYGGFRPDTVIAILEDMVNGYVKIENSWNWYRNGWYKKGMFNWYQKTTKKKYKIRFIKQVESISRKENGIYFTNAPGDIICDTLLWEERVKGEIDKIFYKEHKTKKEKK